MTIPGVSSQPNAIATFTTGVKNVARSRNEAGAIAIGDVDENEDEFIAPVHIRKITMNKEQASALIPNSMNHADGQFYFGQWRLARRQVVPDWVKNETKCSVKFTNGSEKSGTAKFFFTTNRTSEFGAKYKLGSEIGFQFTTAN